MVNLRHHAKFRGDQSNVAEIWRFSHFQYGGGRHFECLKFEIVNGRGVKRVKMR